MVEPTAGSAPMRWWFGALWQQTWPRPASHGSGSRPLAAMNVAWWSICDRPALPCCCCSHFRSRRSPSHLRRAKNDALDAVLIAACAAALDPPEIAPDLRLTELADYLTFLEQIEEDIRRFKTRLEHIDEPALRRIVDSDIARLKARRAAQICDIAYDDLAKRLKLVLSVPGIGERTALAIVIRMPELGRVSREEPAGLAGVAPFDGG